MAKIRCDRPGRHPFQRVISKRRTGSCQRDHALFLAEDGIRCNGFSPLTVGTTGLDFFYKQHRGFPSLFFTVCVYYSGCFLTFPLFSGRRRKNKYSHTPNGPRTSCPSRLGPAKGGCTGAIAMAARGKGAASPELLYQRKGGHAEI